MPHRYKIHMNNRKPLLIVSILMLAIWSFSTVCAWFMDPGDAFAYSLIFQIILLPLTYSVSSGIFGSRLGTKAWPVLPIFGVLGSLNYILSFGLMNLQAFNQTGRISEIIKTSLGNAGLALALSAIGFLIGILHRKESAE